MIIENKPFILIIGVQKAGTTSIHKLISNQVEVSLPKIKETHFYHLFPMLLFYDY